MIETLIVDGRGRGNHAKVNGEGELSVVVHPHPPKDEEESAIPVTWDFESAGSNDMRVSGSAASPVHFDICAETDADRYVKSVFVTIADAGAALNEFEALAALTNGCRLLWISQSVEEVVVNNSLKSNWEWLKLMGNLPGFGATTNAFRASNVAGASEGYPIFIDFADIFGLPYGLRLKKGTTDCLRITVQDDTTYNEDGSDNSHLGSA